MKRDINNHKRHIAQQLLRDTEQSSLLRLNTWLLVARRLANIIGETNITQWLDAELKGYDDPANNPVQKEYADRTGRLLDATTQQGDWRPITEILADNNCEYRHTIAARLQSLVHEFASDTYYRLEFSDQAESTFQFQRTAIDTSLADYLGNTLAKIPVLYDRLSKMDQKAVGPVLEICQQMITTFSMVVTRRGKKSLLRKEIENSDEEDRMERVREFVKQWCKDGHRADRLIASTSRHIGYLKACTPQNTQPQEGKFLIMQTYMLLAEILALKNEGRP